MEVAWASLHQGTFGSGWSAVVVVICGQGIGSDVHLSWEVQIGNGSVLVLMSLHMGEGCCDLVFLVTATCFFCEVCVWVKTGIYVNGVTLLVFIHSFDEC